MLWHFHVYCHRGRNRRVFEFRHTLSYTCRHECFTYRPRPAACCRCSYWRWRREGGMRAWGMWRNRIISRRRIVQDEILIAVEPRDSFVDVAMNECYWQVYGLSLAIWRTLCALSLSLDICSSCCLRIAPTSNNIVCLTHITAHLGFVVLLAVGATSSNKSRAIAGTTARCAHNIWVPK